MIRFLASAFVLAALLVVFVAAASVAVRSAESAALVLLVAVAGLVVIRSARRVARFRGEACNPSAPPR